MEELIEAEGEIDELGLTLELTEEDGDTLADGELSIPVISMLSYSTELLVDGA